MCCGVDYLYPVLRLTGGTHHLIYHLMLCMCDWLYQMISLGIVDLYTVF